jgi:hypothetical protein
LRCTRNVGKIKDRLGLHTPKYAVGSGIDLSITVQNDARIGWSLAKMGDVGLREECFCERIQILVLVRIGHFMLELLPNYDSWICRVLMYVIVSPIIDVLPEEEGIRAFTLP